MMPITSAQFLQNNLTLASHEMLKLFNLSITVGSGGRGGCIANQSSPDIWAKTYRFGINVVVTGPLILLGLIGNLLAVVVMAHDTKRTSLNILLFVLGICDFIFLLLSSYKICIVDGLAKYFENDSIQLSVSITQYLTPASWYLGNAARTCRNWIIVIVAIDRFSMVRNPFLASQSVTTKRAYIYSIVASLLALLYNLPRCWEFIVVRDPLGQPLHLVPNDNLGNLYTVVYSMILFSVCVIIGPIILLVVFNVLLTASLIKASHTHQALTGRRPLANGKCNHNSNSVDKYHDTRMLVMVISVFTVSELPGCVAQLMLMAGVGRCSAWFWYYLYTTVNFLTVVNSSVNFCVYCMYGKRFRQQTVKLLCNKKQPDSRPSGYSTANVAGYPNKSSHPLLKHTMVQESSTTNTNDKQNIELSFSYQKEESSIL